MKRRGTNRRQVLDLDTNPSSPKRSWQTKYQQICMDHMNSGVTSPVPVPVTQNGSDSFDKKLPQLVGYASDSEGDETKKSKGDLDTKVEDFLKEISEISDIVPLPISNEEKNNVPSTDVKVEKTKVAVKKSKTKTKPVIGPLPMESHTTNTPAEGSGITQPTIAWQECYDENSGCYYYWNTKTNKVTWEMPQDLRAYHIALEQWNAQQALLAQQVGGLVPMYVNHPQFVPAIQQPQKKHNANKPLEKTRKRAQTNSDSEDEKIELITSYGPTSDDEESDVEPEPAPVTKKKKTNGIKSTSHKEKKEEITIGPQLPPDYVVEPEPRPPGIEDDSQIVNDDKSPPVMLSIPESGPIEAATDLSKPSEEGLKGDSDDVFIINTQNNTEKISALQRLKTLKNKGSDDSSSDDTGSSEDYEKNRNDENDDNNEEDDDDIEDSILERLKNQAKILQELGGEIPDEIKELLKPTCEIEEDKVSLNEEKQIIPEANAPIFEEIELVKAPFKIDVKEIIQETKKSDDPEIIEVKEEVKGPENINVPELIEETCIKRLISRSVIEDAKAGDILLQEKAKLEEALHQEKAKQEEELLQEKAKLEEALHQENTNQEEGLLQEKAKMEEELLQEKAQLEKELFQENFKPEEVLLQEKAKLEEVLLQEKAPTSFSLIAGYGNEDDSELEDEKMDVKPKDNEKPVPLFPIVDSEKERHPAKNMNMKVIKLSAKAKELIHSSTTTERARATNFVNTSDGLRPAGYLSREDEVIPDADLKGGFVEPLKKVARKKRLEVPVVVRKKNLPKLTTNDPSTTENKATEETKVVSKVLEENTEAVTENSVTPYSSAWVYNSELQGGEHRGFGYEYNYELKTITKKKGMIQFIKSDTLMPKNEPIVCLQDKTVSIEGVNEEDETNKKATEQTTELTQLISEKVKFLCEGKEAVPPVQVMAIQLETLMAALSAGGLCVKYLVEWVTSLDSQLATLEQAAAPLGWQCLWDRSYKRYYYRNEESGAIQWEYPSEVPTQGGEEAMELCDSPPPPVTTQPAEPEPPQPPVTPPPPRISTRSPSPDLVTIPDETPPPLPPLPPPPPVISEQPPLPPLPPSESPPRPPLPPTPPPPPPPPIISSSIHAGEPLPPGVDLPEDMYDDSQPPLPVVPPPPPKTPPPPPPKTPPPPPPPPEISEDVANVEPVYSMGYNVAAMPMHYDPYQMQTASDYSGSVYQQAGASYSSGGENYVIARPPASNPVPAIPCLATELDSFYSEVAALDPPPPPVPSSPSPPPPPSPPAQTQPVEPTKKRKKTKLTPGLALKKKGVSSLVAKWQQVQQDVRREEET